MWIQIRCFHRADPYPDVYMDTDLICSFVPAENSLSDFERGDCSKPKACREMQSTIQNKPEEVWGQCYGNAAEWLHEQKG